MDIFENYIVIYLKKLTTPQIIIKDLSDNKKYYVKMPHQVGEINPGLNKVYSINNFI